MPRITKFVAFVLSTTLITVGFSINQECNPNQPSTCPANSFCNEKQYCQCQQGWALNCKLKAPVINQNPQKFYITKQASHFTIVPSSNDSIYVYRFNLFFDNIDIGSQESVHVALYADEGTQNQLSRSNFIGKINLKIVKNNTDVPIFSPYMTFQNQPNDKIQQMILQVYLDGPRNQYNQQEQDSLKKLQSFQKITSFKSQQLQQYPQQLSSTNRNTNKINGQGFQLTINVEQIFFMRIIVMKTIVGCFMGFFGVSILICLSYCLYSIRRAKIRGTLINHDIKYFQEFFPKIQVKQGDQYIGHVCSICLLQYEKGDKIRKTFCNHSFHCQCLDQWCRKQLTCPICRNNLSKGTLQQRKKQQAVGEKSTKQSQITGTKSQFQLQQQQQLTISKSKSNIKTKLLQ